MVDGQPKVVLGLGNFLNRDEGLSIRAVEMLRVKLGPRNELEFVDGGGLGLVLTSAGSRLQEWGWIP